MTADEQMGENTSWTIYGILALALLLALLFASLTGSGQFSRAFRAEAEAEASRIDSGCQSYRTEYGALPPTSENYALTKVLCGDNPHKIEFLSVKPKYVSPNHEVTDPWGTPFRITFESGSKVRVLSAGPDEVFGTPDDISNQ